MKASLVAGCARRSDEGIGGVKGMNEILERSSEVDVAEVEGWDDGEGDALGVDEL